MALGLRERHAAAAYVLPLDFPLSTEAREQALARRADVALQAVTSRALDAVAQLPSPAARQVVNIGGTVASYGAIASLTGVVLALTHIPGALVLTPLLLGATILGGAAKYAITARATHRANEQLAPIANEVAAIERAAKSDDGVIRGTLALRLDKLLHGRYASLRDTAVFRRLKRLQESLMPARADEAVQAGHLAEIHDMVYDNRGVATNIDPFVERLTGRLHDLPEATRKLVPESLRAAVIDELARDPKNTWRLQRFCDAWEGKRIPYATPTVAISPPAPTGTDVPPPGSAVASSVEQAVTSILRGFVREANLARIVVDSSAVAEHTAGYFETRGMSAVLYGSGDRIVVTVHDTTSIPSSGYLKGVES